MNFELNKIFGAILGVMIFVMGIGFIAQGIYASRLPTIPGLLVATAEAPAPGGEEAVAEPIAARLAKANIGKGDAAHKPCVACHSFEKGGADKQGPGLWGIVGNKKGTHPSFVDKYSDTLKKLAAEGQVWGYEELDGFLTNPKKYSPGTSMGFAGYADPQKRADLIAWLREQDDTPEPLPAQ